VAFVLALAYGAYELYGALKKPDLTPKREPGQAEQASSPSKPAPEAVEPFKAEKPAGQQTWGRDPFIPVSTPPRVVQQPTPEADEEGSKPEELRLRAISRLGEEACVLINRYVCSVGDVIEGYRVAEIRDYQVVLTEGNRRIVLTLPGR
jgi:hypothetical protein